MKILVASSTFPTGALDGSIPRFVYDLADALSAHAEVTVLAPHHPGAATRERMGSVRVTRFPYWWPASAQRLIPNMRQQLRASALAKLQIPFFIISQIWHIRRAVSREGVDVVNAHWMIPQGITAAFVRGRRSPRFVLALHVHASDVYLLARLPLGRAIARYIMTRTNVAFADGSHVRDTLDRLIGYKSGARLQPMGVHREIFSTRPPDSAHSTRHFPDGFILFVGRLVEKKGVTYLLRSFPRVLEEYPGMGLVVVGDGPDAEALGDEARALGIESSVEFLSHQPHARIVTLLHRCRVAVVPSIIDQYGETEGMPTVVVEMMAAGVRVVGSAVDGIPDVISHAENGWLCREKDPEDLAEKILIALDDESDSSIVRSASETAKRYDWAQVAHNYMDALQQ